MTRLRFRFAITLLAWMPANAICAGFAVLEQSVSGMGRGYAGATAGGEDISTLYYNPAGLSLYSGTRFVFGGTGIVTSSEYRSVSASDITGSPIRGTASSDVIDDVVVPYFYFSTELSPKIRYGLAVNSPFALAINYGADSMVRYSAIRAKIRTININPGLSVAVNDQLSLGFGLSALYSNLKVSNAVDFGTLCFAELGPGTCTGLGLLPQGADGKSQLKLDDWAWSYNLGILFTPSEAFRLGIAYRSKLHLKSKGRVEFNVPQAATPLLAGGAFRNSGVRLDSDLPETIAIGSQYALNNQWKIMADVVWTRWNRINTLNIRFDNPAQANLITRLNFKNTIRLSLGSSYEPKPNWILRAGFLFDESPVRNARNRNFLVPDSDRYWITAGIGYRQSEALQWNFAYAHVFFNHASIDNRDAFGHRLSGGLKIDANLFNAELLWRF